MAIYESNLVKKRHRHRGIYSGKPYQVAGRIKLAAGAALTTDDTLLFVPVGENQSIKRVTLEVHGDTAAAAGSIGYFQMTDANGDPVRVERLGPFGDEDSVFESPASDPDFYRAAGQMDGYTETIVATPLKLAGPVNIGIDVTTGGTMGADTEIILGVEFDGETSQRDVLGADNSDNEYLLDNA